MSHFLFFFSLPLCHFSIIYYLFFLGLFTLSYRYPCTAIFTNSLPFYNTYTLIPSPIHHHHSLSHSFISFLSYFSTHPSPIHHYSRPNYPLHSSSVTHSLSRTPTIPYTHTHTHTHTNSPSSPDCRLVLKYNTEFGGYDISAFENGKMDYKAAMEQCPDFNCIGMICVGPTDPLSE